MTVSTRSVAVTPSLQLARELEADHLGQQHRKRLAEHGGFGLDAADAPAEHGEAVDHGRVGVGADQRVGIGDFGLACRARPCAVQTVCDRIFEVDLMADAGAGRHDAEIVERLLAPFQEPVALAIALVFELDVLARSACGVAEIVDDDRMVDDQIDGHQRIDLLRIAAQRRHRVAHRGEIDHRRHAGEVLHQHARRAEGDLVLGLAALSSQAATASMSAFLTVRPSS